MSALFKLRFPVPRILHICKDKSIVGTEFYVMEFVTGRIFDDAVLRKLNVFPRFFVYS